MKPIRTTCSESSGMDVERFESEGGKVRGPDLDKKGRPIYSAHVGSRPARASDLRQFNIDHAGPLKRDMLNNDDTGANAFRYWFALIAMVSAFGLGVVTHIIASDAQTKTKTGAEAPAYSCTATG